MDYESIYHAMNDEYNAVCGEQLAYSHAYDLTKKIERMDKENAFDQLQLILKKLADVSKDHAQTLENRIKDFENRYFTEEGEHPPFN